MNTYKASNIPLKGIIKYLENKGAKKIRTSGGHLIYSHRDLARPIPLQSHIDPVPEFIVKQILKHFDDSVEDFWKFYKAPNQGNEPKAGKTKRGKRS